MKLIHLATAVVGITLAFAAATCVWAEPAIPVEDAIWVDDELYRTVITSATFLSPPLHSTDAIYSFMMSGLMGQRSIAEAAPGDRDYNGGRWNVQMVTFTDAGVAEFDMDGDMSVDVEITNLADLMDAEALGYVEIMPANFYFECPLRPSRGQR